MRMLVFVTMLYCPFKVGCNVVRTEAGFYSRATLWHGIKARFGIWEIPDVQNNSTSGSYIAAFNQSPWAQEIAAGFHVHPSLYGDNKLHFFTHWISIINQLPAGCFNELCPGFVVADGNNLYPGQSIDPPFSTYGQEEIQIILRIKKDERTGDWSLYREDKGGPIGGMTLLGWWPKTLFNSLSNQADAIEWTGFATYDNNVRRPPMGSGHFANELNNRAASFSDCFGFDKDGNGFEDKNYNPIAIADKPGCYSVSEWYHTKHNAQRHFFYGGPGGCTQ
ncbi:protein neprosin-like isoform X2 [Carex rostrata]